ncbi:MAG: hypothetical protein KDC44_24350, partial [Phaeodactylibacter sp.]|nr:hypothetical protein [Phaeodactylibacter sp.]
MRSTLLLTGLSVLFLFLACSESTVTEELPVPEPPYNPFSDIDYNEGMVPTMPLDSNTFLGLHTYIFSTSCNQPACHDGTFEPDFRTVQSAYNSLVLHPVKKNYDGAAALPYRVTPGEPNASMLYKRITIHNPPNFERMPASGNPLPESSVTLIKNWIEEGAKDIYGNDPMQSSLQPFSYGLTAYLPDLGDARVDTIRGSVFTNPFLIPGGADQNVTLKFLYLEATPAGDTILGSQLGYNRIRFSKNPFDFTDAPEIQMTFNPFPEMISSVFSQDYPIPLPYHHSITINPADLGFVSGDVVFMRTYVQDSDHNEPTEIPQTTTPLIFLTYFAF